MSNSKYYIQIKDEKIPIIVRNYRKSSNIKIFFRENILNISKPKWYSIDKIIKEYGDELYTKYKEIISTKNSNIRHFFTGEEILYKGNLFKIIRKENDLKRIHVSLDEVNKILHVTIPKELKDETKIRDNIVKCVKKLFRNNTSIVIEEKLEIWCKKMNLDYTSFKVNDTTSKYGSCMPKSKKLFFSLRLIMLPDEIIDLIVVHELAHLVHANHSKDFYNYIKKYIPDYDNKDKWLKKNSNLIVI